MTWYKSVQLSWLELVGCTYNRLSFLLICLTCIWTVEPSSKIAKRIANNALELPSGSEREHFVKTACFQDPILGPKVEKYLRQNQATKHGSDTVVGDDPLLACQYPVDALIDNYRVIRKLGEGGFGEVYHAFQEKPVRRDVAVKVLKRGMDSRQILARFEAERQALAIMDHIGIAKIFDAGTTESGQPYFVMEYVKGIPITQFCDRHRLSIRERVQIFVEVCHAIQHAHQKGLIHRDIKPSNVLVSAGDERPKSVVIDFGVAKATQPEQRGEAVVTQAHQIIGTPAYMSPEQADNSELDIDTRSDVYSLGVVLYELLSGCLPHAHNRIDRVSALEAARIVREVDPPRPSLFYSRGEDKAEQRAARRGESASSAQKALAHELDWVAMKCLEKSRTKRYETVSGLAIDCQRYLDNEPVTARRHSALYGLRKFVARHRAFVFGFTMAVLLLFSALTITLLVYYFLYSRENLKVGLQSLLSDYNLVMRLEQEYDGLPEKPLTQRRQAIDQWLTLSEDSIARISTHEDTIRRALSHSEVLAGEPVLSKSDEQWQEYLSALEGLASSGLLERVGSWKARCPTADMMEEAWRRFEEDIERSHPHWRVNRRAGLHALGKNAETGLWEFVDLNTGLAPLQQQGRFVADGISGVQYVLVPGGTFAMGSPEGEDDRVDKPKSLELLHNTTLAPFLISPYELTESQAARLGHGPGSELPRDLKPAAASWLEAKSICASMNAALPTEAQWEYACRAGVSGPFSGTQNLDDMGWYDGNSHRALQNVGEKQPNQFGLYDMHGNSLEWTLDIWDPQFYARPEASQPNPCHGSNANPGEPRAPALRVLRGGSFQGAAKYCRSANRYYQPENVVISAYGCRPCLNDVITVTAE